MEREIKEEETAILDECKAQGLHIVEVRFKYPLLGRA
jgi:hypothetical protein